MKKIFKKILLALAVMLVLFQFYPRAKNNINGSEVQNIATIHHVPSDVQALLKTSCYDCHSNNTLYPWYYNIQPIAWWLDDHIMDGKKRP